MQNRNPYAAPQTNVTRGDGPEDYGEVKILSVSGRLGRVRYIGYSVGLSLLIIMVMGAAVALVGFDPNLGALLGLLGYAAVIVLQFMLTIQRAHDMNTTGWLSLIMLIPLAGLVFWFVPGTRGENNYGKQPPPNTAGVIVLACLVPFIAIVGILAAIAIPAYQDYTIRAQVSEGLNLAAAARASVADAYLRTSSTPADRIEAGMSADATDSAGKYVASVDVAYGTILVSYGNESNSMVAGRVLALQPFVRDQAVVWRCGYAAEPGGAVAMDSSALSSDEATDLEPRYLPSACRP
jgi:uncharacterized membrane protein YhaH (DUF805 family)/Tfp pilus assembly major pilin PilA